MTSLENSAPFLMLWNSVIPYWFFINSRRVVIVTKVSTVYTSAYAGFILPDATPSENPYPLYVSASGSEFNFSYSISNYAVSSCANPTQNCAYFREYGGSWVASFNRTLSATLKWANYPATRCTIQPYYINKHQTFGNAPLGQPVVHPISLMGAVNDLTQSFGELDGVFCVNHTQLAPEDTITDGPDLYTVFPDVYRIGRDDLFCVKMV